MPPMKQRLGYRLELDFLFPCCRLKFVKALNFATATDITKRKKASITCKVLSGFAPDYLSNLLKKHSALDVSINLCNVTVDVLVLRMRTCIEEETISFWGCRNLK